MRVHGTEGITARLFQVPTGSIQRIDLRHLRSLHFLAEWICPLSKATPKLGEQGRSAPKLPSIVLPALQILQEGPTRITPFGTPFDSLPHSHPNLVSKAF